MAKADKTNVVWNDLLVTSSRGQHPDEHPLLQAYFGNYPEDEGGGLGVDVIVHRKSDGTVDVRRNSERRSAGTLAILLLGQYEAGFPNYRALSLEEKTAINSLINELVDEGKLAEGAPVRYEYGLDPHRPEAA